MSVDSVLDEALTILLAKAQRSTEDERKLTLPATFNFEFGGGGLPPNVLTADPIILEVPFPCSLFWAHLWAGDALLNPVPVTATIDLQVTSFPSFGSSVPVYGSVMPALTLQSSFDVPIGSGWLQYLIQGDALTARLVTFTGVASWVALTLLGRPTDVPIGVTQYTGAGGAILTNAAGGAMVSRARIP